MPNDVTWQPTGAVPPRPLASPVLLPFIYAPVLATPEHYFHNLEALSYTHTHNSGGAVSEKALILTIWMAYRCNFSKHTSQILLMPSKTPGGTLA